MKFFSIFENFIDSNLIVNNASIIIEFLAKIYLLSFNIFGVISVIVFLSVSKPTNAVNPYIWMIWMLIIKNSLIVSSASNLLFVVNSDRVFLIKEKDSNNSLYPFVCNENFSSIWSLFWFFSISRLALKMTKIVRIVNIEL
jgi:hypothetical protein